ncbi:MAG: cysteine synthase A [Clostridia bacterium]
MIFDSVLDTIGNTPLIRATRFTRRENLQATLLFKLESKNPGGSAKDRIALWMIRDAEENGSLKPGGTVIEATSGNTGIGLGLVAAVLGYHVILTMPDSMSIERQKILRAFGAELILTPGAKGMAGANEKAEELERSIPGSIRACQFENDANPAAHRQTTGPEIWRDTEGALDAFVACVGTGGTVSGVGQYLKMQDANIRVFAVEPEESPLLSGGQASAHGIQGIGANFIPETYDPAIVDAVLTVSTQQAFEMARKLMVTEGILCGISSGAAAVAAVCLARKPEMFGKTIVTLLTDTGERYLSTALFA